MPTYKELFAEEICKCGKKGIYIITNSGKISAWACETCKPQMKKVKEKQ